MPGPGRVDVDALGAWLDTLDVRELVAYADAELVRLTVARLVLERRDPAAFDRWIIGVELAARAHVERLGRDDDDEAPAPGGKPS